jgi:hypothetical protein
VANTINVREGVAQFFVVPPAGFESVLGPGEIPMILQRPERSSELADTAPGDRQVPTAPPFTPRKPRPSIDHQ